MGLGCQGFNNAVSSFIYNRLNEGLPWVEFWLLAGETMGAGGFMWAMCKKAILHLAFFELGLLVLKSSRLLPVTQSAG